MPEQDRYRQSVVKVVLEGMSAASGDATAPPGYELRPGFGFVLDLGGLAISGAPQFDIQQPNMIVIVGCGGKY